MASDVAVAVPYGSLAQGQSVFGTASGATTAYSAFDSVTVTAAAGQNAGTTPPAPVVAAGASPIRGSLTWGTGSAAAAGTAVAVSFGATLPSTPQVVVIPTTQAAGTLGTSVQGVSTTGFNVLVGNAPAASQGATIYGFSWVASL